MEEKKFKYQVKAGSKVIGFGETFSEDVAEAYAQDKIGESATEERDGKIYGVGSDLEYTYKVEKL